MDNGITNKNEIKVGYWASVLSASFALIWFITFNMKDYFQKVPDWKDLEAYAQSFTITRHLYIYPSMLLALTYLILLVCVYRILPESKKLWSLIALAFGILYATMASINYNIQAVAVRLSLRSGETGGTEMFLPDNTHSVFNALANTYVYMALSMFFIAFAFSGNGREKWIRIILLIQIITAVCQAGYTMFDLNTGIFIAGSMIWVIGAPASFILLAGWFRAKSIN